MKIKETKIEINLIFAALAIMSAFVIPLCCSSCSAPQKSWAEKEKELCTPQHNTIKITWCDEKKVYYIDDQGHEGWFRNKYKEAFFVGDIYFKKFYN